MRPMIIQRYIWWEMIPPFALNLLVFTFIMLMARMMDLINLIIIKGVSIKSILWVFLLMMPKQLIITLPMAVLLAILSGFLRLAADSELTVIKASGISLKQLSPPVILLALIAFFLTLIMSVFLSPWSNWQFRQELLNLAKARADLSIKEQVFVKNFPGLVIYVGHIPSGLDRLEQVFIKDDRIAEEASTISAKTGYLMVDQEQGFLIFQLENGIIDRFYGGQKSTNSIDFERYELKISPGAEFTEQSRNLASRSETSTFNLKQRSKEILGEIKNDNQKQKKSARIFLMEWHRRWAMPVSCLTLSFIALSLGANFKPKGRNFGLILGLIIFLIYYACFTLLWGLAESGKLAPWLAMWLPNSILFILGVYFYNRVSKGKNFDFKNFIKKILNPFLNLSNSKK